MMAIKNVAVSSGPPAPAPAWSRATCCAPAMVSGILPWWVCRCRSSAMAARPWSRWDGMRNADVRAEPPQAGADVTLARSAQGHAADRCRGAGAGGLRLVTEADRFYREDGPPDHVPPACCNTRCGPREEPLNPYANRPTLRWAEPTCRTPRMRRFANAGWRRGTGASSRAIEPPAASPMTCSR